MAYTIWGEILVLQWVINYNIDSRDNEFTFAHYPFISKKLLVEFITYINIISIERKEVGLSKTLGDYLNRIAYHESVHTD